MARLLRFQLFVEEIARSVLKMNAVVAILWKTASGLGVGANPTTWFVAVAFLTIFRLLIDLGKEAYMRTTKYNQKGHVKSSLLRKLVIAFDETF
jgi:hypothetical protein